MVLDMVVLVKLHLLLTKPAVVGILTSIVCVLKLLMGFRFFKDEALHQSRLLLCRFGQIAFRSIFPTMKVVSAVIPINSTSSQSDHELQNEQEEMFYSLSMLAL
jgi:protein arginine N-methyltransferase 7